jgi:hypothetical protein
MIRMSREHTGSMGCKEHDAAVKTLLPLNLVEYDLTPIPVLPPMPVCSNSWTDPSSINDTASTTEMARWRRVGLLPLFRKRSPSKRPRLLSCTKPWKKRMTRLVIVAPGYISQLLISEILPNRPH